VFALQNYAEAQKHEWRFRWTLCTERNVNFRECAFDGTYDRSDSTDKNVPVVLRNGEDDGDVRIEVAHSFWYGDGESLFDYRLSGVYLFEWSFQMGAYCTKNGSESEYAIGKNVAGGSFNITIDATAAPNPTMTIGTCASFLGAVSYTNSVTSWDFRQSVANSPGCVGTASVTKTPEPCRATLDAEQIGTVMNVMGWAQASATGTASPTETGRASDQAHPSNAAENIKAGVVAASLVSFIVSVLIR
jgi:hypothetical protein